MKRWTTVGLAALALGMAVLLGGQAPALLRAQTHGGAAGPAPSPYAGQETSSIRGLTEAEIQDLRSGAGMGLARPAELNGYPGPLHVLELADELTLTAEQRVAVQTLFQAVRAEAAALGDQFLDRYAALEQSFREGSVGEETLRAQTAALGQIEGELRAKHLEYHLRTRPLLTDAQLAAYRRLRGYTGENGPAGHGASGPHQQHGPGGQHGMER